MGAISGIVSFEPERPVDVHALIRMHEIQRHRGQDGGRLVGGRVGFASRSLALHGRVAAVPPMSNESATISLAFCGELFNAADIRRQLKTEGWTFRASSDEESVLRAYEAWGAACLERFNGQFALAIWDARTGALLLARDAMGIYPLHYLATDGQLLFASEAKGVLAHPDVEARADEAAIAEWLLCGTFFDGRSLFAPVRRLQPGCTLTATRSCCRIAKYWDLPRTSIDDDAAETRCREELAAACEDAVKVRITPAREWGVLLSGGTDSSALSAWAQRVASVPVQTFSIDFPNPWQGTHVDRRYAELTAERLGTVHRSFVADPGEYFSVLERLAWHVEKPYGKAAATLCLLSDYLAPHARFVLSGEGMDEMLAGYVGARGLGLDDVLARADVEYFPWAPYFETVGRLCRDEFLAQHRPFEMWRDRLQQSLAGAPRTDPLSRSLHLYTSLFLPDLLELHDQSAFAAGVQTRYPYLDRRCVELMVPLPPDLKFRDGETKYIFKQIVKDLVPADVLSRRKTHLPMPRDPQSVSQQIGLARELLLGPTARTAGYFDPVRLGRFLSRDNGRADALTVWQVSMNLITLELVHRAYGI